MMITAAVLFLFFCFFMWLLIRSIWLVNVDPYFIELNLSGTLMNGTEMDGATYKLVQKRESEPTAKGEYGLWSQVLTLEKRDDANGVTIKIKVINDYYDPNTVKFRMVGVTTNDGYGEMHVIGDREEKISCYAEGANMVNWPVEMSQDEAKEWCHKRGARLLKECVPWILNKHFFLRNDNPMFVQ